jgi:tetratricopeptide (TPR) repeat protein
MADDKSKLSDLALGHLTPEESLRLLDRIEDDPIASEELDLHIEMVNTVKAGGDEIFGARQDRTAGEGFFSGVRESAPTWAQSLRLAYVLRATVALLVPILILLGVDWVLRDPYAELAQVEGPEFNVLVRAGGQEDIDLAYRLLDAGQREEALRLFERYARAFPQSEIIDYVHYSAGAVHLRSAQRSFFSLFLSYDQDRTAAGMTHLRDALDRSANMHLIEESHWLLAKGYLMLHMPEEAREELQLVMGLDGWRKNDATRLFHEISNLR